MKLLCLIALLLAVKSQNQAYKKRTIWNRLCNAKSCTKCLIAIDGFHLRDVVMPYQPRCLALMILDGCCPMRGLLTKF